MEFTQAISRLHAIAPRTRAALVNLSAAQFTARPPDGGWSIAQVFEHLCITNSIYLGRMLPEGIERAKRSKHGPRAWRPSLVGGLLLAVVRESNALRLPAPGPFRVGSAVRPDVVEEFLEGVPRLEGFIHDLEGHDLLTGITMAISPLVRVNVGDACVILVEHAHRHLAQVERTRRAISS